jgi:hypothetical protein
MPNMMTRDNDKSEEWNIVHRPLVRVDTEGIVSGIEDLTITTTEFMDSPASDAEVTKYEKQGQFEEKHCPATLYPEVLQTLKKEINELRRQLNKLEVTFASLKDNENIKNEKYLQYLGLLNEAKQFQPLLDKED